MHRALHPLSEHGSMPSVQTVKYLSFPLPVGTENYFGKRTALLNDSTIDIFLWHHNSWRISSSTYRQWTTIPPLGDFRWLLKTCSQRFNNVNLSSGISCPSGQFNGRKWRICRGAASSSLALRLDDAVGNFRLRRSDWNSSPSQFSGLQ